MSNNNKWRWWMWTHRRNHPIGPMGLLQSGWTLCIRHSSTGYCVLYIALTATTARPMLHSIHPLCKRTRPLQLWRSRWPSVFGPPQLPQLAAISSLATIVSPTKPPNQWSCHLVCAFRRYEGTTYSALGGSPDLPGEAAILGAHLPSHCKL